MTNEYIILISIGVSLLISIPLAIWYWHKLSARRQLRKAAYKELTLLLEMAILSGSIRNSDDLTDFVNGFNEVGILNIKLPHFLKEILVKSKHNIIVKGDYRASKGIEIIETLKIQVDELIKESELSEPFVNVPTSERNLLMDILELSRLKSNEIFVEKLHKLGDLIRVKEESVNKLAKDSEESLRIAKQSKIFAILFFIISIALTVYTLIISK